MGPKYFSTSAFVFALSMSPEMTSVALFGTYHLRKNALDVVERRRVEVLGRADREEVVGVTRRIELRRGSNSATNPYGAFS